tara:strand:+ start:20550 stop:21107 length:558 start_codon:yes stop_codon:yes gene_type:complete
VAKFEKGKRFKIPTPIFDRKAFGTFKAVVVDQYRKITFDKSNPRMSNDKPFPTYSEFGSKWVTMNVKKSAKKSAPKEGYSYKQAKEGNMLRRQNSSYASSTAPYVSGDLMRDTDSSFSLKDNAIYIGWTSHANKVKWLRDKGRFLTSRTNPINPKVIKKLMPSFNKELKRIMPKGTHTINIGKKK